MSAEDDVVQRIHRLAAGLLVAAGDATDHPEHPEHRTTVWIRQVAQHTVLRLTYGVPSIRGWELHRAVGAALAKKGIRVLDPTCPYCRVIFAMDAEAAKQAELERLERIRLLTEPSQGAPT